MTGTRSSQMKIYLTAVLGFALTSALIIFPKEAFAASLEGLKLWFEVVMPALLPFLIMAKLLMSLGVVNFIGALLEPIMQPIFRIPGTGAFAVAIGLASGYPIGAKITADLRRNKLCTQIEAERLLCFANTAGPLFIAGAVSVGMFGMPELAVTLFLAHYLSAIAVGLFMRYHGRGQEEQSKTKQKKISLTEAVHALVEARKQDNRPLGQLFHEAVSTSFPSLFFIGGCIAAFSVLSRILELTGITPLLADIVSPVLAAANINHDLIKAVFAGFLEIDIGAAAISQSTASIVQKAAAVSAVLAWSGLSVHAQVAAMIHDTDLRMKPYIIARALHAICAGITAAIVYRPLQNVWQRFSFAVPVFSSYTEATTPFFPVLTASVKAAVGIGAVIIAAVLILCTLNRVIVFWVNQRS